jgi:site-specific recombinase XerD
MGTFDNVIAIHQPSFSGKLGKPKNNDVRPREHMTPAEVESLVKAAKETGCYGHRDATTILIAFRHGLRVSELVALRWDLKWTSRRAVCSSLSSKAARPPCIR